MVRKGLNKDDVCELDPAEILERFDIVELENKKGCIVIDESTGKMYSLKSCNPNDVLKKITKGCDCGCGGPIEI